jgi:C_GCAxxG_C_C family probable redox protein
MAISIAERQAGVRQQATDLFVDGFNCAEAILRVFRKELNLDLGDNAVKIASGFGCGLGRAGCICGALTGCVMVISLLQGRTSPGQNREPVYASAHEFHRVFSDHFGTSCCRVLNPHLFGSEENLRNCQRITGETAGLLAGFLAGKGFVLVGK